VFSSGLNFFGTTYHSIYINNNGNITFSAANSSYVPAAITGAAGNPIIAPFWADVDTRHTVASTVTPGGHSTGSDLVYQSLDTTNHVLTVTWDDVGHYSQVQNPADAFQVQLIDRAAAISIFCSVTRPSIGIRAARPVEHRHEPAIPQQMVTLRTISK
jgi:hypothetical protein